MSQKVEKVQKGGISTESKIQNFRVKPNFYNFHVIVCIECKYNSLRDPIVPPKKGNLVKNACISANYFALNGECPQYKCH